MCFASRRMQKIQNGPDRHFGNVACLVNIGLANDRPRRKHWVVKPTNVMDPDGLHREPTQACYGLGKRRIVQHNVKSLEEVVCPVAAEDQSE